MEQALPLQGFSRKIFNRVHEANFSAAQIVPVALFAFILLTSLLLMLPFATTGAEGIHFIDAFFTMTSAICVTGLIVLDTPKDFPLMGQLVMLSGIQVGGLGYSTMATLLLLALRRRIGLRQRMMMMEVLSTLSMEGLVRFVKVIVAITLIIETVGALILAARFAFDMGPLRAIYLGVFHSVSAFNNAGFSLFSANLAAYRGDIVVNLTIAALIILGGIGFIIFRDLLDNVHGARFRLSTHTKLALLVTLLLIVGGTVGIWAVEAQNQSRVGNLPFGEQILVAYFHSVAGRTVGLSTGNGDVLSLSALFSDFGKALIIMTMFLGRLGPLALGLFAVRTHEELRYRYAEAKVVIG